MNPKLFYWYYDSISEYKFRFDGGYITVEAENEAEARILAQAEAIKNGWNYEILPNTMSMEELKELIGNKVDEIFNAYAERTDTHKELEERDETNLNSIENILAEFIVRVCK